MAGSVSHQKSPENAQDAIPGEAPADCALCPRLNDYIARQRLAEPDWFNAPVPSFGPEDARLLIVGLAPGVRGANRTGRPFTGDHAGTLLYSTLNSFGFANDRFDARIDDGLVLHDCMITNGVRCVPPENRPTGAEIRNCRRFLIARINALPRLRAIMVLGRIAHDTTLRALGLKLKDFPFAHGARHDLTTQLENHGDAENKRALVLFDSYHCSRYNTNTGRLSEDMFRAVFRAIRNELDGSG